MQIDFHYYIAYAIAKEAGFDEKRCNIIAYASQYTDDNTDRRYDVEYSGFGFRIPFPDKIEDRGKRFHPIITQAVSLEAKEIETQRYVYAPFHFLPVGNLGKENKYSIKGRENLYCTIANSRNARNLMADSIKNGNPYRIGIAMHTFADTFSHERFSAFEESWNMVKTRGVSIKRIIPAIGHAQIIHTPDIISNVWSDNRFRGSTLEEVDNSDRAMDAINKIYKLLKPSRNWTKVESKFREMIDAKNDEERIKFIRNEYPQCVTYEKDKWFNEALKIKVDISEVPLHDDPLNPWKPKEPRFYEVKYQDDFENSHWYRFQMAAKEQLAWVLQKMTFL